jgi:hypothetical protein
MKKVLFTITILVSMIGNMYANNLQLAQGFYNNDDIENAVSAINNAMNSPQNKTNPEAWILMYRIFKKLKLQGHTVLFLMIVSQISIEPFMN